YCLNFLAVAELEGSLNSGDLQTALDIVQQENPTLRTQITTNRAGRPCFKSVSADERPLILEVHELRNWRKTIDAQLMRRFVYEEAPLARFLWFRGRGTKSVVAMVFHHSIADGKSGVCALLDVLRRAVGQDRSPHFKEAQPSSQQLDLIQKKGPVAGKLKELRFWLGMGKDILKFAITSKR
ncbi:MAG: condensation domain-containing protein, partial [Gammaproteobacteria bacterium]|nr:condensation domain-containing protein [Gammaproteobacteria bacterium]